jgi:hypothetical protein
MERARERASSIAILTAVPMVAQLIAGRAVRDAVFLTEYPAVYLPRVMLAAALLSLGAAIGVSRAMPTLGPRRTAIGLTLLNGLLFVVEGATLNLAPEEIAVVTYVHVSIVGALVISAFSSVVNERFDPLYAKTVVSRVGTGAALGGVLGGVSAFYLSDLLELSTVLYCLGSLSMLVGLGIWNVGASTQPQRTSEDQGRLGIRTIGEDGYLRQIAATIVMLGAVGVLVDYGMKAEADAKYTDSAGLLSFFAAFYMATSLLTFFMQAAVAKPLLRKVGLGGTMAVLPLVLALNAGLAAVWTRLWTATLARGSQTVLSSSLFRSGYELLYTPIPPLKKRATKALIDIACNRIGYGLGSVVVMAIVATAASPEAATRSVMLGAAVAALVSAWMIRRLHTGYVGELASSLREGSIVLHSDDLVDATTLHTLARTAGELDRGAILERVEELRRTRGDSPAPDAAVDQLSDLLSREPQRVLRALIDPTLSPHFASYVIELLGDDAHARAAYGALERMGGRITGQLIDAMLHPDTPVAVRRRVPRILRKQDSPRAVRGLLEGLRDDEFDVRYRCGHALAELRKSNPELELPRSEVMRAVEREMAANEEEWQHRRLRDEVAADDQSEIDALLESRNDRNLQHVFTLLSLAIDGEAIVLSLRALSSHNENLRGTSLEYLHNVLPERVRDSLWPRLTERSEQQRMKPSQSSPEELLKTMRSLTVDRDRLEQ